MRTQLVADGMDRKRNALVVLACIGWTGTLLSHVIALHIDYADENQEWKERRNQFLLLSSLTTNTLVLSTVYRYGKRIRKTQQQWFNFHGSSR